MKIKRNSFGNNKFLINIVIIYYFLTKKSLLLSFEMYKNLHIETVFQEIGF